MNSPMKWLRVIGRLAPGITPAQAEAEARLLASRSAAPKSPNSATLSLVPAVESSLRGRDRTSNTRLAWLLGGIVGLPAQCFYCFPIGDVSLSISIYGIRIRMRMTEKTDVWQGTLALMVLKTLQMLGPLHGYGIARRIEQTSGNRLVMNYGTLYPSLLKLEQEGYIVSSWGVSDNNRRAKYYRLTRAGERRLERGMHEWQQAIDIVSRFVEQGED